MHCIACVSPKSVIEGKYLLKKNKIKGVNTHLTSELEEYLKQAPNSRFMGTFPINLWTYKLLGAGKENQWKPLKKLGEPPVYFDQLKAKQSAFKMQQFLFSRGYFNNKVKIDTRYRKKSVKVNYIVQEGVPYRYNVIKSQVSDEGLKKQFPSIARNSLIQPGVIFNQSILDQERQRITRAYQDSGYFFFDENAIVFDIDSTVGNKKIDITISVLNHKSQNFNNKYMIENVFVYGDYDMLLDSQIKDTIIVDDIYVISDQLDRYVWSNILNKILLRPGLKSSFAKKFELTYEHLLGLSLFNYVDIKFDRQQQNDSLINCHIYLKSSRKMELNAAIEGNTGTGNALQNSNTLGLATRLIFRNKNIFKGGQILQMSISGELETQLNPIDRQNQKFNTLNLSIATGVEFPNFLFIPKKYFRDYRYYRSKINAAYDIEDRFEYLKLESVNFGLEYDWFKRKKLKHFFSPLNLNYLTSNLGAQIQPFIDKNIQLKNALENQWILGSDYHIAYSSQQSKSDKSFWLINSGVDMAGNSMYLVNYLSGGQILDFLGASSFSQYVKLDADLRNYISLGQSTSINFRITGGIAKAFGNSNVMPYIKQFYIGGANSIRAWRLRTLGPGSYSDSTLYLDDGSIAVILDQTGEMKIESNAELRFPISKSIKGALFLDVGNIWNLRVDRYRPGARFSMQTLYNDLAIGSGFGLRWDFSFFIVRLDWGVKLKDPRFVLDQQWVLLNDKTWRKANENYEFSILNLAIGYPF